MIYDLGKMIYNLEEIVYNLGKMIYDLEEMIYHRLGRFNTVKVVVSKVLKHAKNKLSKHLFITVAHNNFTSQRIYAPVRGDDFTATRSTFIQ